MFSRLIILAFIFSVSHAHAQPDYSLIRGVKPTVPDTTESRLAFGLNASADYNAIFSEDVVGTQAVIPQIRMTLGLHVNFKLRPYFYIRTGLYYGRKAYGHIHNGLVFPQDLVGPEPTSSSVESQIQYNIFSLPLILQFNPLSKRFFFASGLAWDYQHLASANRTIKYGNGDEGSLSPNTISAANISAQFSLGYMVRASSKFDLVFEPYYKMHFREYIIDGSTLYNFGLRISLNFNV